MSFFKQLQLDPDITHIDWDITPALTYGLFECRGDMNTVRSSRERYYYFYIDNWEKPPRLCFMERGLRFARVLAHIDAPLGLIEQSVASQGKACKEQNYSIDIPLRHWLEDNVVHADDPPITCVSRDAGCEDVQIELPSIDDPLPALSSVQLRSIGRVVDEEEVAALVQDHDFFESQINPVGSFRQYLVDNGDGCTVTDMVTGITWQRNGSGHLSLRKLQAWCAEMNTIGLGGFFDWRLPTIDEGLSLLGPEKNRSGFHLHDCFGFEQGYIFTADRHLPGGSWFVDFRQARVYWAAATCFSGGFGRLCRTEK